MTSASGVLLLVVGLQAAVLIALLVERRRRARAEQSRRESEEQFQWMVDHTPSMIWTIGLDTTLDYLNGTCAEWAGQPLARLRGNGWLDAVHPEDVDDCVASYVRAMEERRPFLVEYRMRKADGSYRWLMATGVPKFDPDGTYTGYVGCDIDVTERKEAEDRAKDALAALAVSHREIQLLAGRLIESQDAERARVARDLHDDVSQQMAGLSIALSELRRRMEEQDVDSYLQADVRVLTRRAGTLAQNVRNLSHDLHPTVLRHAGLVAALTSYCDELGRAHGTALTCTAEGDFASLAPENALCLYRIAQEALRNVIAHSGATRADVRLARSVDQVEITVSDDGRGFDLPRAHEHGKGLGLVSMTERARLTGGTVSIVSEPRGGTRVRVVIPAHARVASADASPSRALSVT